MEDEERETSGELNEACGPKLYNNGIGTSPLVTSAPIHLPPPTIRFSHQLQGVNTSDQQQNSSYITSCGFKGNHISTSIIQHNHSDTDQNSSPVLLLDGRRRQQQQRGQKSSSRQPRLIETFLSALSSHNKLDDEKVNRASICLLGVTLVASVLNVLLLSFVVKSIQLNDKGFIGGKISWDEQLASTVFRLTTRLPNKSISLKSIVSHNDEPLRLEACSKEGAHDLGHNHAQYKNNNDQYAAIGACPMVLAIEPTSKSKVYPSSATKSDSSKSNFTAVNFIGKEKKSLHSDVELEIETELLVWNLINRSRISTNQPANNPTRPASTQITSDRYAPRIDEVGAKNSAQARARRLLELDSKHNSISLPLESQLNLDSAIATSMVLNEELESSEITGSLEENLDIQTRNGNLACKSASDMNLVSKSSVARFSAFDELVLSAPSLTFSAGKHLYLPDGIPYFDSPPPKASQMDTLMTPPSAGGDGQSLATSHLKAYSLVILDGILMAVST